MNLEKYSKDKLIYFLQLTLSQNKSNIIYFSLDDFDKLFIDMNVIDWTTNIYLYSSNIWDNKRFLCKSKLRDYEWIILFVNYIDWLLNKYYVKDKKIYFDFNNIK